jgi:ATP-dependent Clp protease ATP-binding subunit ClpA
LVARINSGEKLSTDIEIPFTDLAKDALKRAALEADDSRSAHIEPEHLLLGVLVNASGFAADALRDAGVEIEPIRQFLKRHTEGPKTAE